MFYYILYLVSYYKTIANRKAERSPTGPRRPVHLCGLYPTPPALPYGLFMFVKINTIVFHVTITCRIIKTKHNSLKFTHYKTNTIWHSTLDACGQNVTHWFQKSNMDRSCNIKKNIDRSGVKYGISHYIQCHVMLYCPMRTLASLVVYNNVYYFKLT